MPGPTHGISLSLSTARLIYDCNDDDDLLSIQRWLFYGLAAAAHGINLFRWGAPEQTFERPAITLRLIPGSREADYSLRRTARSPQYDMQHQVAFTVYHNDRVSTVDWGRRVERLLRDGTNDRDRFSIPLYSDALGVLVARSLRVLRPSIEMGVEDTDDEDKWNVTITAAMTSPRLRTINPQPILDTIATSVGP